MEKFEADGVQEIVVDRKAGTKENKSVLLLKEIKYYMPNLISLQGKEAEQ